MIYTKKNKKTNNLSESFTITMAQWIMNSISQGFFSILFHESENGTDVCGIAGDTKQKINTTSCNINQILSYFHNAVSEEKDITIIKNTLIRTSVIDHAFEHYNISMTMSMIFNEKGKSWIKLDIFRVFDDKGRDIIDQTLQFDLSCFEDFAKFSNEVSKMDTFKLKIVSDELLCKLKITEYIAKDIHKTKVQNKEQLSSLCSFSFSNSFIPEINTPNYLEYHFHQNAPTDDFINNIESYSPDLLVYSLSDNENNLDLNESLCKRQIEYVSNRLYTSSKRTSQDDITILISPSYDYDKEKTRYKIEIIK